MRLNVLELFTAPRGSATLGSPGSGKVELLWRGISEGKHIFSSGNFAGHSAGGRWCGRAVFSSVRDAGVIISARPQSKKVPSCPAGIEPKLCKIAAGGCSHQRRGGRRLERGKRGTKRSQSLESCSNSGAQRESEAANSTPSLSAWRSHR